VHGALLKLCMELYQSSTKALRGLYQSSTLSGHYYVQERQTSTRVHNHRVYNHHVYNYREHFGRDREMEVLRDMWQLELEIINRLLPNPGAFKETLERPFLILRD
jgi:hypothetical protein